MHRTVANIAMVIQKESVFRAAVALFSALVEGEEDFISSRDFADSVMGLVDAIKREETVLPSDEPDLGVAELLFAIVTKTRQQPELLSTWFKIPDANAASGTNVPTPPNFVGNTLKDDFPLCYHLVDYVHCDGKTGDFARTGLLYIFDTASHSYQLEEWLVESDLPTLMASGLGALYSQLSR